MAKQGNIKFGVGFDVDKSGLEQLKSSIASLQNIDKFDLIDANADIKELNEVKRVAGEVGSALQKSFNQDLGTYNIQTFKKNLSEAGLTTQSIGKTFATAGEKGKIAFRNMVSSISSTKLELKETHNILNKMGETLTNTIRWSIASTAINSITGSIQKAWSFTKSLDSSLNDIMIVTGKSSEEMDKFAVKANKAAKALGANTKAYADAALIYYQQGLSDTEAQARADVTVKAANVTGQSAQAVSEQLTAVWNGYKVSAQESETYIDKLAAVAASTAADLEELSTGMSRVAAAANIMGVDIDQLNAQLATIVSVTREAPESIGTALKTVYARMSDIEAGIDSETTLGEYTAQMAEMGINVLDAKGNLRDMGDVVEEIGSKWGSLNREQQVALAQSIAGTRQYSRMMSLFDNWDQYQEALTTSQTSVGALQKQQDIYMESLEGHLNQLTASSEKLYSKLFDSDSFKSFIDLASGAVDVFANIIDGFGGGGSLLFALIPTLTNLFSKTISSGIATTITNFQNARENAQLLATTLNSIKENKFDIAGIDTVSDEILALRENLIILRQQGLITNEQFNELGQEIEEVLTLANKASTLKADREAIDESMGQVSISGSAENGDEQFASIEAISNLAGAGQTEKAEEMRQAYLTEIEATRLNSVDDLGEASFQEGSNIDAQIETLRQYRENLQAAAQESGLLTAEQLEDLTASTAEIDKLIAARERELQILQEQKSLEQMQEEKAGFDQFFQDFDEEQDPDKFSDVGASAEANEAAIKATQERIAQLQAEQKGYEDLEAKADRALTRINSTAKKTSKQMGQGFERIKKVSKDAASGIEKNFDQKTKQAQKKVNKNLKKINFTGMINQVTSTVSALGQLAAAINVVTNIGSIWDNDDISTGQKMLTTLTSVLSVIGLMTPAIGIAKNAYTDLNAARQASAAISNLIAAGNNKEALSSATSTLANLSGAAATKILEKHKESLSEETYKAAAANIAEGGTLGATAAGELAAAAASGTLAGAKTTETGAVAANTAAWYANPIMWIAIIVVAALAAVVGLVAGIIALTNALDEEAQAQKELENATQHANEMAEAFANAKKEYEDLKASIEDYRKAQKAIDEMVAGTEEWTQAIAESNAQVMELIKKYPELAKYMSNEAGRLVISDEGLDAVLAKEQTEMNEAQRVSLLAQQRQSNAKLNLQAVQAHEELDDSVYIMNTSGSGSTPTHAISTDETQEVANILAKSPDAFANKEAFTEALKGTEFASVADALWNNRTALEELTQATIQTNAEQEALRKQIALSMLQENAVYKGLMEEYGKTKEEQKKLKREDFDTAKEYYAAKAQKQSELDAIQNDMDLLADIQSSEGAAEARKQKAQDQLQNELGGKNALNPRSWTDKQKEQYVKEYYSKLYGISESDVQLGSDEDGKNFSIKYIDKDGKQQEIDEDMLSWEEFGKNLLEQRTASMTLSTEELNAQLANFKKLSDNEQKAFRSFVGDAKGDFSQLTEAQFKEVAGIWKDVKWDDVQADPALKEKLKAKAEALGLGTTDEALQELLNGITAGVENYENEQAKISTFLSTSGLELDDDSQAIFDSFNQQTKKLWAQRLKEAALVSDEAGAQVEQFFNAIAADSMSMVNTAMEETDWTNARSVQDFTDAMLELEEFNGNPEAVEDFVFQMKYAQDAIESFNVDKVTDDFSTLEEILNEVASDSRSISAEQYESLSLEMQDYFLRMADGTYALIGAAEDFRAVARSARKEANRQRLDELAKKAEQDHVNKTTLSTADRNDIENQNKTEASRTRSRIESINDGQNMSYETLGFDDSKDKYGSDPVPSGAFNQSEALDALSLIEEYYPESGLDIKAYKTKVKDGTLTYDELDKLMPAYNQAKTAAMVRVEGLENGTITAQDIAQKEQELANNGGTLDLTSDMKGQISQMLAEAGNEAEVTKLMNDLSAQYSHFNGAAAYIETEGNKYKNKYIEDAKDFKIDTDPYEAINNSLEKANRELEKLAELQEMVYGEEAINAIRQYNNALRAQIYLLDQKLAQQKEDISQSQQNLLNTDFITDREDENGKAITYTLAQMLATSGIAIEYDENGSIVNWEEVANGATAWIRSNYSEAEAESFNERLIENKENYDELIDEYMATQEERRAKSMEILEKNLEAFELELDLKINENELKRSFKDFKASFIDENDFSELGEPVAESFNLAKDDITAYTSALEKLNDYEILSEEEFNRLTEQGIITDNQLTAAMKEEKHQELLNSLMDSGLSLQEEQAAMLENIVAYHEKMNELYDNYVSLIENVNSALDHQRTLMELIYGDKVYQRMESYYTAQVNNLQSVANMRKMQMNESYANMLSATSDEERKALESIYLESADSYFSALNDFAAMRQEQYLNELNRRFDAALGDFESKKDDFDWEVSSSQDFLNPLDAAFGVQSVERAFDKSINVKTSIEAQAKLNKLRDEELAILKAKDKLTKYDLDRAQKRLEIAQAEIALQEAQANKSKMRLVRGADGTYSYQYEADMDAISKAEEDLAKANQDLVDLDNKELESQLNNAYSLWEEYKQKLTELDPNDQESIQELTDRYRDRISALGAKAEEVFANLDSSVTTAAELLGEDISIDVVASWATGEFAEMIFDFDNFDWTAFGANIQSAAAEANADIVDIQGELEAALTTYLETIQSEDGLLANTNAEIDATRMSAEALSNLRDSAQAAAQWLDALVGAEGSITSTVEGEVGNVSTTVNFPGASAETGMYTGEWGAEGRIAMLHEKELVLNKADTSNILAAVDIVRQLENALSSSLLGQILGLTANGYAGSLEGLRKLGELKQNVNITAEFPNATDKNEIEAAFDELINLATQKIYETR